MHREAPTPRDKVSALGEAWQAGARRGCSQHIYRCVCPCEGGSHCRPSEGDGDSTRKPRRLVGGEGKECGVGTGERGGHVTVCGGLARKRGEAWRGAHEEGCKGCNRHGRAFNSKAVVSRQCPQEEEKRKTYTGKTTLAERDVASLTSRKEKNPERNPPTSHGRGGGAAASSKALRMKERPCE